MPSPEILATEQKLTPQQIVNRITAEYTITSEHISALKNLKMETRDKHHKPITEFVSALGDACSPGEFKAYVVAILEGVL